MTGVHLRMLRPILFRGNGRPDVISIAVTSMILPALMCTIPSNNTSRVRFPIVNVNGCVRTLLAKRHVLPTYLIILPMIPR